jgi:hypothetical protein
MVSILFFRNFPGFWPHGKPEGYHRKRAAEKDFPPRAAPWDHGAKKRKYYSEETVNLRIPAVEVMTILL